MRNEKRISVVNIAPKLMSRKELSYLIGVSEHTLLSWKEKGSLIPYQSRGNIDIYDREQIQCFSGMLIGLGK